MRSIASEHAFLAEGFRVWTYRSIRDSGFVPLACLTALVGREQSGKTNLLLALAGLDPRARSPYSAARDWPRGRRPQPNGDQVVCALNLRLHPAVRDELVNEGTLRPESIGIRVGRTYDNEFRVTAIDDLILRRGSHHLADWDDHDADLRRYVLARLPALLFGTSGSLLPDRIELDELVDCREPSWEGDLDRRDEVGLRALASLLGLRPEGEASEERESLVRELDQRVENLNHTLEQLDLGPRLNVGEHQGQLKVAIRTDRGSKPIAQMAPARRLQLTLDLRIAAAHARTGVAPALLLDAPGKAFKGGLKRRLRPTLLGYANAGVPVIYSSRLPFHVELQHPEQVLVLGPSAQETAALCAKPVGGSQLTPIAALGMQGRSSFLMDQVNLVVEGPTDVGILRALGHLVDPSGEPCLPEDLNIISAGGAFEVAAVVMFLAGQGLHAVGLFDSDPAGLSGQGQLEGKLATDGRMRGPSRALGLSEAAGLNKGNATIEDLFPVEVYLDALGAVADDDGVEFLSDLRAHSAISEQPSLPHWLEKAFHAKGRRFPKVEVASELERRITEMASTDDLPGRMRPWVLSLLHALRAALTGA
ncbi:MAG: hypothetical protein ACJA2W_001121 [Planctomycetota bacterium]|jgi:hypothetical protein